MTRLMVGCLACAFLGSLAAPALGQPSGYIVNASDPTDDGTHDNLWRVDLATGEAQRIGPLNVRGAVNSDVEGLALESPSYLFGVDDATDSLVVIDTVSGTARTLDRDLDNLRLNLGGSPLDPGLATACDGRLLMSSTTRRTLYSLNKLTGQASIIGSEGSLGVHIGDLAIRGTEIFGIGVNGDEGLYAINGANGTATRIGAFGFDFRLAKAGLDFDSSGNLWAVGHIIDSEGQPQPSRILKIDRITGVATPGPTTLTGVKSLSILGTTTPARCGPFDDDPVEPPRGDPPPIGVPVNSPFGLRLLVLATLVGSWVGRRHFSR
jgi:hypothetical protein